MATSNTMSPTVWSICSGLANKADDILKDIVYASLSLRYSSSYLRIALFSTKVIFISGCALAIALYAPLFRYAFGVTLYPGISLSP